MTVRYADTFYFLALLNEDDAAHQSALEYAGRRASMLVTTDWVIVEVADALAAPAQRPAFLALWEEIRQRPAIEIVPADRPLLNRGLDLYARRLDKEWSLTDCISFVVMGFRGHHTQLSPGVRRGVPGAPPKPTLALEPLLLVKVAW